MNRTGRPSFTPTDEQRRMVRSMAAYGVHQEDIARVIGINSTTLRKYFFAEIDTAAVEANAKVAQTLFKMATDPTHPRSAICAIFWLKTRARWTEAVPNEVGKKEQVEINARTAERGSRWDELLN